MISISRLMGAIGACAFSIVFQSVHANLVTNPSFETFTGTFASDGGAQLITGSTTLTGWGVTNGEVAILTTPNNYNSV